MGSNKISLNSPSIYIPEYSDGKSRYGDHVIQKHDHPSWLFLSSRGRGLGTNSRKYNNHGDKNIRQDFEKHELRQILENHPNERRAALLNSLKTQDIKHEIQNKKSCVDSLPTFKSKIDFERLTLQDTLQVLHLRVFSYSRIHGHSSQTLTTCMAAASHILNPGKTWVTLLHHPLLNRVVVLYIIDDAIVYMLY